MCNRPSRSVKRTVRALTRFSSVRYLRRSSRILSSETRFLRCSLALRLSSSSSSYDRARKLRSSLDMDVPSVSFEDTRFWAKLRHRLQEVEMAGFNALEQRRIARRGRGHPIEKADARDKRDLFGA